MWYRRSRSLVILICFKGKMLPQLQSFDIVEGTLNDIKPTYVQFEPRVCILMGSEVLKSLYFLPFLSFLHLHLLVPWLVFLSSYCKNFGANVCCKFWFMHYGGKKLMLRMTCFSTICIIHPIKSFYRRHPSSI